jgi:hypothetical protein
VVGSGAERLAAEERRRDVKLFKVCKPSFLSHVSSSRPQWRFFVDNKNPCGCQAVLYTESEVEAEACGEEEKGKGWCKRTRSLCLLSSLHCVGGEGDVATRQMKGRRRCEKAVEEKKGSRRARPT